MEASSTAKKADFGLPGLGLSIDLSISVQSPPHQTNHLFHNKKTLNSKEDDEDRISSLQLDLLPRPVAQKTTKSNGLLWQSLFRKSTAETTSDSNEAHNSLSGCKGLDMNQIPCLADCYEESGVITTTSFQLESTRRLDAKRERESDDQAEQMTMSRAASDEEEGGTRKKLRLSKDQSALLEESFKQHSTLNPKQKNALAKQLNLRPRQVEVWFQNRRARTKLKQTEVDCELLKKYCEGLSEENRRLQKELHELRQFKISPPCVITHDFYMPLPATTLTMCPSCERLAAVDSTRNHASSTNNNMKQPAASFHNTSNTAAVVTSTATASAATRFSHTSHLQPV